VNVIRPDWPTPRGVRAAFTLRTGGVSEPPFDTLNLGLHTGDEPHAVIENRRRVREALQLPAEPTWLSQVHGAGVVTLGAGEIVLVAGSGAVESIGDELDDRAPMQLPRGDASVTREPGRVCAIQVADCIPVLLAARNGSAVAAAHAGWRGLAGGVLEATVRALRALAVDPSELIAWLGPGIGPSRFEVGEEVRAAFVGPVEADPGARAAAESGATVGTDPAASAAFIRNGRGRWQCDLAALARRRLAALGVREVYGDRGCTHGDAARFFSYRRDGRCGRMAALIWIER
jgi:polyphenol oxidase